MRQVLFHIPLHSLWDVLPDIPIFGYGTMLFVAFVLCLWLAVRLGRREGLAKEKVQDLAVWIFISGIIGARAVYIMQYRERFDSIWQVFKLWDGGLVFYGAPIGGVIGYFLAYFLWLRKLGVSTWSVADVIAPCLALGLALGRIGCLLNGCCYGNVACANCPALHFPLSAPPIETMVKRGYQTLAGFSVETFANTLVPKNPPIVRSIERGSRAELAGLKIGDKVVKVFDKEIDSFDDLEHYLRTLWPRGQNDLELGVERAGQEGTTLVRIGPYHPVTLGLNPTQIYESISMALLLFFLLAYYPYKSRAGLVMVLFMVGYGVHRFLNEMLRTDTEKVALDMTLSQNISVVVVLSAAVLALVIWRRGPRAPGHDSPGTPGVVS